MRQLTGTLVADGSSDSLLKPLLEWLLSQHLPVGATLDLRVPEWGRLPLKTPLTKLPEKLLAAQRFFSADVYFVHRDAEKEASREVRCAEIDGAVRRIWPTELPAYVRVVPVQMTETWLFHNHDALRAAAENPHGRTPLEVPDPAALETTKDAKTKLLHLLRSASELTGRRLRKFEANERRRLHRLAELQQEQGFAVLRALPAFRALEAEIAALATAWRR